MLGRSRRCLGEVGQFWGAAQEEYIPKPNFGPVRPRTIKRGRAEHWHHAGRPGVASCFSHPQDPRNPRAFSRREAQCTLVSPTTGPRCGGHRSFWNVAGTWTVKAHIVGTGVFGHGSGQESAWRSETDLAMALLGLRGPGNPRFADKPFVRKSRDTQSIERQRSSASLPKTRLARASPLADGRLSAKCASLVSGLWFPAGRPADRPTERPPDRPSDQPTARPTERPVHLFLTSPRPNLAHLGPDLDLCWSSWTRA